jgi:antibiotic biosynthesis monooxygenase (ABM) superfamily enzyme
MFQEWDANARTLTEGEPVYRELHGLEAWFRSPHAPPPRWKMAIATLLGVFPTSLLLGVAVAPFLDPLPMAIRSLVIATCMVALLTWVVMPAVTKILHPWLHPKP